MAQREVIREAIEYGSIFNLSPDTPVDTVLEVISDLLPTLKQDERLWQAYQWVCRHSTGKDQYVNGIHFLARVETTPEYGAFYFARENDLTLPVDQDNPSSSPLINLLTPAVMKFHTDAGFRRYVLLACEHLPQQDGGVISTLQPPDILVLLKYRYHDLRELLLQSSPNSEELKVLLNTDAIDMLPTGPRSPVDLSAMVTRGLMLREKAPFYWRVVEGAYRQYLERGLADRSRKSSREFLLHLHNLFPSLVDERILNLSLVALRIHGMPAALRAYYLGFPLQWGIPSASQLTEALHRLSEQGVEAYTSALAVWQRDQLKLQLPRAFGETTSEPPRNETDILAESIYDYSPFDVITHSDNGFYHAFTRAEFDSLLKKKQHYYTQKPLSSFLLKELSARLETASQLKLPPSRPLAELLNELNREEVPAPVPPTEVMARHLARTGSRRVGLLIQRRDHDGVLPVAPRRGLVLPTRRAPDPGSESDEPASDIAQMLLQHFFGPPQS